MKFNMSKVEELLDANEAIEINFFKYEEQDGMYVYGSHSFTKGEILEKAAKSRYFSIGTVSFTNEKDVLIENVGIGHNFYMCLWDKENNEGDFIIRNIWTGKKKEMKNLDEEEFKNIARFME